MRSILTNSFKKTLLLTSVFVSSSSFSLYEYESHVEVAAISPIKDVNSNVYYAVLRSTEVRPTRKPPIKNCILMHGHGINSETLVYFKSGVGKRMNQVVTPFGGLTMFQDLLGDVKLKSEGLIGSTINKLKEQSDRLNKMSLPEAFGEFYFGRDLLDRMATEACDRVYIVVQESVQSSVQEMSVRMERFVRDVACRSDEDFSGFGKSCALIGHSKSGAVATNILRRCMADLEATVQDDDDDVYAGGSRLGAKSCSYLSEVITLAGANQGLGMSMLLLGSNAAQKRKEEAKNATGLQKILAEKVEASKVFEKGEKRLKSIKMLGQSAKIDIFGEKREDSNPSWFDLSPFAPVEYANGKEGRKLVMGEVMGNDFIVTHKGSFKGRFSSFAGFNKLKAGSVDTNRLSCGTIPQLADRPKPFRINPLNEFRDMVLEVALQDGLLSKMEEKSRADGVELTAEEKMVQFEVKEKMRASILSVSETPVLDFIWQPFLFSQHVACELISGEILGTWEDPAIPFVYEIGKKAIFDFSRKQGLTTPEIARSILEPYEFEVDSTGHKDGAIYFNETDGMIEYNAAISLCERSKALDQEKQVVGFCGGFRGEGHLAMSGLSLSVSDAVVKTLKGAEVAPKQPDAGPREF